MRIKLTALMVLAAFVVAPASIFAEDAIGPDYEQMIKTALANDASLKRAGTSENQAVAIIASAIGGEHGSFNSYIRLAISAGLALQGCHESGVKMLLPDIEDIMVANDLEISDENAKEVAMEVGQLIRNGTCSKQLLGYLGMSVIEFENLAACPYRNSRLQWLHKHLSEAPWHGLAKKG